jgi:hypothetical protein
MSALRSIAVLLDSFSLTQAERHWLTTAPASVWICSLSTDVSSVENVGRYTVSFTVGINRQSEADGGHELPLDLHSV